MSDQDSRGTIYHPLPRADAPQCTPTADGHCITCSDEALSARVIRVDQDSGLALVQVEDGDATEEIDVTLVDTLAPGDLVLVHGGVAIALLSEASNE